MSYFRDIRDGIQTTLTGLGLTMRHLRQAVRRREVLGVENDNYFEQQNGLVTVQYPHEQLPIPDNGRYRLHNEIDDCIVCDKCAKICPVDCITIEPIKATEEIGRASDGSPIRLYAATFDIDMAKCCYCGLCTVVCPTECLTMEKTFDYSTYELDQLTYAFANLTPEQADEKRALYEQYVREKEAAKAAAKQLPPVADVPEVDAPAKPRPAFRPGMKPAPAKPAEAETPQVKPADETPAELRPDAGPPVFRPDGRPPRMKPVTPKVESAATEAKADELMATAPQADTPQPEAAPKPKPVFRPGMKPKPAPSPDATPAEAEVIAMQGVANQPGVTEPLDAVTNVPGVEAPGVEAPGVEAPEPPAPAAEPKPASVKPKPSFLPSMKPVVPSAPALTDSKTETPPAPDETPSAEPTPKPRAAFRPTMKPKTDE